ncbi:MAG: aminoacyl-tRNA hydrolase [Thermodesulfobacteriota bacterium]
MKVIVGLGNPGVHYQGNRHNIGFQVVNQLAENHQISISTKRLQALYGTGTIDSQAIVLAKPMTFMNRSGEAVRRLVDFFHVDRRDLIVVHDDLDLPFGRLRFKRRGGDGGHQGVRSIIEAMGGNAFLRLKVGIGRPPRGMETAEYVLCDFDETEQPYLNEIRSKAAGALEVMLLEGLEAAMNRFHHSPFSISMKILP